MSSLMVRMLWAQVQWLRQQHGQVAYLGDVRHLVPRDHPADVEQGEAASMGIGDGAFPFRLAPAVKQVDSPATDPGEVLDRLVKSALGQVPGRVDGGGAGVDGRPDVGSGEAVQVRMSQQRIDL